MRLADYLKFHNIPHYKFAVRVGVSPPTINAWTVQKKVPRKKNMDKVFAETKGAVTYDDWVNLHKN